MVGKDVLFDSRRWVAYLFCGGVLYLTLLFRLGSLPFLGADEPRYARIGQEMLESGNYVTPTLRFEPWLEKPPLLFWMEAGSYSLLGVSEASARLPVALLGLLTVCATAWFTARHWGSRPGFLAALVLPTSGLFFAYSRAASTDLPLTAGMTAALLASATAAETGRLRWVLAAAVALAIATLAKGPVAALLFTMTLGLVCLLTGRFFWKRWQTAVGSLLFFVLAVPWFWLAWLENGYSFIATFWLNHHLARFLTSLHHHSQPIWYYAPVLLIGFFPWVFFLGSSLRRLWRFRSEMAASKFPLEFFLWVWALTPILFFTVSSSKLAGYILPSLPAFAILVALEWDRLMAGELTAFRSQKAELAVLASFATLLSVALVLGGLLRYGNFWIGLSMAAPILLSTLLGRYQFVHRRAAQLFLCLVGGMTLTAAVAYWRVAPVVARFHSAKEISLAAKALVSDREPLILYKYFHHSAQYYTDYHTTREALPEIEDVFDYLLSHPQKRYFVLTQKDGWPRLRNELDTKLVKQQGDFFLVEIDAD